LLIAAKKNSANMVDSIGKHCYGNRYLLLSLSSAGIFWDNTKLPKACCGVSIV